MSERDWPGAELGEPHPYADELNLPCESCGAYKCQGRCDRATLRALVRNLQLDLVRMTERAEEYRREREELRDEADRMLRELGALRVEVAHFKEAK